MSESGQASRFRSPPFPSMSLQKAIERAEQLYRQERDHMVPMASAARAWGMSPTSSGPILAVGALRQYGLLEDEGSGPTRKVRLTHGALRIILDKIPTSPERQDAVLHAFFAPKIYSELWGKWKAGLPSDQTIVNYLVLERRLKNQAPFSEQAASELLANYKASMAFASPVDQPNVSPPDEETGETVEMEAGPAQPQRTELTPQQFPAQPQAPQAAKVRIAENERVVFVEEGEPNQYLKVVASGELDEIMLDALSDYINRQKRRLNRAN